MSEKPVASAKPLAAEGPAAATAPVVLVVENERLERVSAAMHLRKSGFDVIEAADGDEARRILDSVHVNVVFADLAAPGQTNGLALLHWLRERHPAIKTIVTSGTETDMAAPDGYGMLLSKPYRPVDLDYCLQKVLATERIPADETPGAMTGDPGPKTSPGPGKVQPDSASPDRPPAPHRADGREDEISRQWMPELSYRLGERAARQQAVDPAAAKASRRAALEAYDRARARRQKLVLGFAVGVIACSGIVYLVPMVGLGTGPQSQGDAANTEQASLVSMAIAARGPALPEWTSDAPLPSSTSPTSVSYTPAVEPAAGQAGPAPASSSQQAPVEPAPNQALLRRAEAREIQARLRSLGFNPGPVDGVPGPTTEGAVMRYQQARGQPQTGKVDRELLEQLRQDPAPQVVQRATGPYARPTRSPGAQRSDPFQPLRAAGDRLGQWLQSLGR